MPTRTHSRRSEQGSRLQAPAPAPAPLTRYDAIIVGSGAGGGPLALRLAQAGLRTLVLEKGPRLSRDDYRHDELQAQHGFLTPRVDSDPHMVVTRTTSVPIASNLGWIASCVGGGTAHMGSYLYRFHPDDLRMASRFGRRDGLADWPFSYDELEPFYTIAEREVGVSGRAGANPFEGPRSQDYPMPPLDAHPFAERFDDAARTRGLHPFPTPRGINSRPYGERPPCEYCEGCASYGCPVGARGSTQEALLPRAEATGNCEIVAGAMVKEIPVDRQGRATGCVYIDSDGQEIEVAAKLVCVCCSPVESARLLLLSRSPEFPDGLANRSGLVGKHLQFHSVSMGYGEFSRSGTLADPHPFLGRSVMDHYFLPPGVSDLDKGGLLRFGFEPRTPLRSAQRWLGRQVEPVWGTSLKQGLRGAFRDRRAIGYEVFHDFLANEDTFVELDPEARDRWGLPAARIHLDLHPHHRLAGQWLTERAHELLGDLGAEEIVATDIGGTSAYLVMGTCRAGQDPKTSVLDRDCRTHDVPNLFVVDGSFMPTSGGAPPTLTILANSFRVAERIVAASNDA